MERRGVGHTESSERDSRAGGVVTCNPENASEMLSMSLKIGEGGANGVS